MNTDWTLARCVEVDPDLFFPEKGHHTDSTAAKRICMQCPIRVPCAELGQSERYGVWGGTTPRRRGTEVEEEAA